MDMSTLNSNLKEGEFAEDSCNPRCIDLGDGDSVPADFFFEHYASYAQSTLPSLLTPLTNAKTYIIQKASNFLKGYLEFDSSEFTSHLHNIYNHFRLDEELFLFSLIVLYRYVKITRKALQLKRDSELFYLLILCIIISFKCILDVPIDNSRIAKSLNLDASRLRSNEGQILTALGFNVFFGNKDISELDVVFPVEALSLLSYSADIDTERVKKEREKILNAWKLKRLQKTPNMLEPNVIHALISTISPEENEKQKTTPPAANPTSPSKVIPNSLSPEASTAAVSVAAPAAIAAPSLPAAPHVSKGGLSLNAKPFVPQGKERTSRSKKVPVSSSSQATINNGPDHHAHTHTYNHKRPTSNVTEPRLISLSLPVSSVPPLCLSSLPPPPPPAPVSVLPPAMLPPPQHIQHPFTVFPSGGFGAGSAGTSFNYGGGHDCYDNSSTCWIEKGDGPSCCNYRMGTGVSLPLPLPLPQVQSGMGSGVTWV